MYPLYRRLSKVLYLLCGISNILYCFQIAGICLLFCVCTLTCNGGYIWKRPSGCYYSRRQCEAKVGTTGILLEYVYWEITAVEYCNNNERYNHGNYWKVWHFSSNQAYFRAFTNFKDIYFGYALFDPETTKIRQRTSEIWSGHDYSKI